MQENQGVNLDFLVSETITIATISMFSEHLQNTQFLLMLNDHESPTGRSNAGVQCKFVEQM